MAAPRRLSAKHQVYAAALAVAVLALIYDQCRSPGPASARASAIPPLAAVARPLGVATDYRGDVQLPPASSLAARLRAVAGGADPLADLRDAFTLSAAWAADRQPPADRAATVEAFAADHKLSVVMRSVGRASGPGSAVIGGRLVRMGQSIDGYRLTEVEPRSVRLRGPDGDVDLRMP